MAFPEGRLSRGNTQNGTKDKRENLLNSSKIILEPLYIILLDAVPPKALLDTPEK
jgi:hypothetical protein